MLLSEVFILTLRKVGLGKYDSSSGKQDTVEGKDHLRFRPAVHTSYLPRPEAELRETRCDSHGQFSKLSVREALTRAIIYLHSREKGGRSALQRRRSGLQSSFSKEREQGNMSALAWRIRSQEEVRGELPSCLKTILNHPVRIVINTFYSQYFLKTKIAFNKTRD